MHAVFGGDRVERLDPLQGFEPDLGFELGTVQTSFLGHGTLHLTLIFHERG